MSQAVPNEQQSILSTTEKRSFGELLSTGSEWIVDAAGCDPWSLGQQSVLQSLCDAIIADLQLNVIGSPQWMDKVEYAAKECERLGLELSIGSCAGWVAGGPWITPELSMQDIVWRHTYVEGPVNGRIQLPQPTKNRGYYRDIAVLAYPTLPGEAQPLAALNVKVTCAELPDVDWSAAIDGDAA